MAVGALDCVAGHLAGQPYEATVADADTLRRVVIDAFGDGVRCTLTFIATRRQADDELCDPVRLDAAVGGVFPAVWAQIRYDPDRVPVTDLDRAVAQLGWVVFERSMSQRHRLIL